MRLRVGVTRCLVLWVVVLLLPAIAAGQRASLQISFDLNPVPQYTGDNRCFDISPEWESTVTVTETGGVGVTITKVTTDFFDSNGNYSSTQTDTGDVFAYEFDKCGPGSTHIPAHSQVCGFLCFSLAGEDSGSIIFTFFGTDDNGNEISSRSDPLILFGSDAIVHRHPEGRAPNLVVLVHGCCTDANDVIEVWDSLGKAIADTIIQNPPPEKWEIVVLDWSDDTPKLSLNPFMDAYNHALERGHDLADVIADHRYNYVHLIVHSAGSNLIDTVATGLLLKSVEAGNKPFIYLTFLDAYTPENNELFYGRSADYAEHYVDRGLLFTDECLVNAFNFDITNWTIGKDDRLGESGHQWPHRWYKSSVPFLFTGYKYGYPLSLEGSGKNLDELVNELAQYPDWQQCSLLDIDTSCIPAPCW